MHNHNLLRDFFVYVVTSVLKLLMKGDTYLFIQDIKVFWLWRKFRVSSKSTLDFRIPWMAFDVINFLKKWLQKDMIVFEYGSGGSSLFISDRVKTIYSIEHNERWFKNVKAIIQREDIKNIEYKLFLPVSEMNGSKKSCGNPHNYHSCMGEFKDLNFENYVRSIDMFPESHFDLVIIDGRARPSCIMHAMGKVKRNGALLVDNTDRSYYLEPFPELFDKTKWKHLVFNGHTPYGLASVLYKTTVFIKK